MPALRALAAIVCVAALAAPARAQAPVPVPERVGDLVANISFPGDIALISYGPFGSNAIYYERVGTRLVPLGTRTMVEPFPGAVLDRAGTWRCDRLVRRFEVHTTTPRGTTDVDTFSIRTPSCRNRLAVSAPSRVRTGRAVTVTVRDRFHLGGYPARLCAVGPGGRFDCKDISLRPGESTARQTFVPRRGGRWRIRVEAKGFESQRRLLVGGAKALRRQSRTLPTLLTTGDSTMQGVDGYLADRLASRARAETLIRPGTGISKAFGDSWLKTAHVTSSTFKPRLTVVSIGANDGFTMRTPAGRNVPCCGPRWLAEYTRRARIMMRSWTRFGGRVLWMTLATPKDPDRATFTAAVNTAVSHAADGMPRVRLVRIDTLITPGGVFSPTLVYRGRRELVRSRDGVHLSARGTEIAAGAVVAQLDRLGWLPRR